MPTINRPIKKPKQRKHNTKRDKEQQRQSQEVYGNTHYRNLRSIHLHEQPCCQVCEQLLYRWTLGTEVHHVIEILNGADKSERLRLGCAEWNLLTVCKRCHTQIHNKKIVVEPNYDCTFEMRKTKLFVDGVDDIRM